MTAKYGDRFRPVPTAAQRDVLDLGELDHRDRVSTDDVGNADELGPERAPGRRWYDSWAARLAVVAALLIGTGGGAYGWDRWRTYEAAAAARGTVDLVVTVSTLSYTERDQVSIGVRYRNEGTHEVVIRDVRLDTDRATVLAGSTLLTIGPGASEAHVLDLRAQCRDVDAPAGVAPPLVIEVEAADGTVSDKIIDASLPTDIVSWLDYTCQELSYQPSFGELYAEVVDVTRIEDGAVVRAEIIFHSGYDTDAPEITAVEAGSVAFTVEYTLGDAGSSSGFPSMITVAFRVNNCVVARDANDLDMTISVSGSYAGTSPGRLRVPPSASLAAELVRMTERACPA